MQLIQPITAAANNTTNQSELEANKCKLRHALENACEQVTIGLGCTCDWLRVLQRGNAKIKQMLIITDTVHLKTALSFFRWSFCLLNTSSPVCCL